MFKREPGIVMAKEVLTISQSKVVVDYEFRNDTDADITTEVAFPVPPYRYGESELLPKEQGFDDFKLSINGQKTTFATEVRASVLGKDVTTVLKKFNLDAATFGHSEEDVESDLHRLTESQQDHLLRFGILGRTPASSIFPNWTVEKRYHWTQTFKLHAITAIHHDYTPVSGGQQVPSEYIGAGSSAGTDADRRYMRKVIASVCVAPSETKRLAAKDSLYWLGWVDFVLTTANTWRQPIEDFTLNIERGDPKNEVSFCWDGSVQEVEGGFTTHVKDLVPSRELRIGFYQPIKF